MYPNPSADREFLKNMKKDIHATLKGIWKDLSELSKDIKELKREISELKGDKEGGCGGV